MADHSIESMRCVNIWLVAIKLLIHLNRTMPAEAAEQTGLDRAERIDPLQCHNVAGP